MNLAYVAGFVDGEGCINFARSRKQTFPRLLVVNTNRAILGKLKDRFGGDIQPQAKHNGWKQAYQWRISNGKCVECLKNISPWIEIKKPQLALVLAWDAARPGKGNRQDQELMALLSDKLHGLNSYGELAMTGGGIDASSRR